MQSNEIQQLLTQMRALAVQAEGGVGPAREEPAGAGAFLALMRESVDKVNEVQQGAAAKAASFERGDPEVNLAEVMVAAQKANISFRMMVEVRNKLLTAYQDIANMPI